MLLNSWFVRFISDRHIQLFAVQFMVVLFFCSLTSLWVFPRCKFCLSLLVVYPFDEVGTATGWDLLDNIGMVTGAFIAFSAILSNIDVAAADALAVKGLVVSGDRSHLVVSNKEACLFCFFGIVVGKRDGFVSGAGGGVGFSTCIGFTTFWWCFDVGINVDS